ncbi:MAG: hypothetical protein HKP52_02240, partial [Desulfofustis sp.]|nr:hypothetical protein [Desulfofustis sp.]
PHSVCAWQPARENLGEEERAKVKSRQGVAVIPVPDDKWGEVAKAFVVPKPGSEPSAEDIIEFTKSHPARFKAPKYVEFGELPKTATGKIQKFKLRDREWQGRARIN